MTDANGIARDQLRSFIERIERLSEEKKAIADDIKDVYAEANGTGFDVKTIKRIVALRKKSEDERSEEEALLDTYMSALGMRQADLFDGDQHRSSDSNEDVKLRLIKQVVDGMQTDAGRAALIAAVDIMIDREEREEIDQETGEIISNSAGDSDLTPAAAARGSEESAAFNSTMEAAE